MAAAGFNRRAAQAFAVHFLEFSFLGRPIPLHASLVKSGCILIDDAARSISNRREISAGSAIQKSVR
ncbi:MAG TPA: hypothetical protein DIT40_03580 [Alphaproteobacteria bacterium]|nr:hypothetical protein [Alphaproteobacteria bacterium]HCO90032.1 hypothetical protein [Alphaproteobacteria bacterium]